MMELCFRSISTHWHEGKYVARGKHALRHRDMPCRERIERRKHNGRQDRQQRRNPAGGKILWNLDGNESLKNIGNDVAVCSADALPGDAGEPARGVGERTLLAAGSELRDPVMVAALGQSRVSICT